MPGAHDVRTDALLEPATYADGARLQAVLADLRASPGLAWNATAGFWAVTRHADVLVASGDPDRFCSSRGVLVEEIGRTYEAPPTIMHTDPPAHTRYRALVAPGFRPSATRTLEPAVRGMATELLGRLPTGAPVDVVGHLSAPFPIRVITAVLGLPPDREADLQRWSDAAVPGATDWGEDERMALLGDMTVELLALAAERRRRPRDDVASLLATVELDGDQLSSAELGMFLVQLLVAGNETTRHAISGGIVALAEHPDQWARLRGDPSLVATAVEEVLRWTTPVTSFLRTTTVASVLGGTELAAGDPVLLLYGGANRDPDAFGADADRFDIARSPNHHLAFGFGHHFCLGASLARLEIAIVLEGLLDRFAGLATAGPVQRTGSSVIAGIRHAPVTFAA